MQYSFVCELIRPYMPKQVALDAQLVCNVLTMAGKKMKSGKFVPADCPVFDKDSMDNLPEICVASSITEEVLDVVERPCGETSWKVYTCMEKLNAADSGFKYKLIKDEDGQV